MTAMAQSLGGYTAYPYGNQGTVFVPNDQRMLQAGQPAPPTYFVPNAQFHQTSPQRSCLNLHNIPGCP